MKKNGYPLVIAVMLVIVFFEAMEITEDVKAKKNMLFGGTLSEVGNTEESHREKEEQQTLSDLEGREEEDLVSPNQTVSGTEPEEEPKKEPEKEYIPVLEPVDESYFDDALFLGDSRMYGMMQYSGLENATFYTSIGLNIYDLFEKKYIVPESGGGKTDLETALKENQFKKIYLMVGLNELGRNTDEGFVRTYREAVGHIKELQPDAIIYVHGILKVTGKKSRKDKIIKNEIIDRRNELLAEIPNGEDIFWIDINEIFCGEDGALSGEYTGDEVHLYAKYYKMWVDYLKEHAYVMEEKE